MEDEVPLSISEYIVRFYAKKIKNEDGRKEGKNFSYRYPKFWKKGDHSWGATSLDSMIGPCVPQSQGTTYVYKGRGSFYFTLLVSSFGVIPEVPFGTTMLSLSMFIILLRFKAFKRFRLS